jgi:hypothetical protein
MNAQGELNLDGANSGGGYTQWLESRRVATAEMARWMGLPIGHVVEVWLVGGIRLQGKLGLQEEVLFIEEERVRHMGLQVDNVSFTWRELESCIRID